MWPKRVGKMTLVRSLAVAWALLLVAVACSAPPTPQEQRHAAERTQLAALQHRYGTTIMGFDIHGPRVNVSVDVDQLYKMSEDDERALETNVLRTWRASWTHAHPHQHALLSTRFIDFHGTVQSTHSVRV